MRLLVIVWMLLSVVLATDARADERVSAFLIKVPSSLSVVFVAETSTATFHRFEYRDGQRQDSEHQFMSIGRNGAGKQRSGDKRTPLGAYFVTERLDTSKLHEKYGIAAFPLDYPNTWDRRYERTGDGIWVHGVDPRGGRRPALDTEGCIALPNEELAKIVDVFDFNQTPVLIAERLVWSAPEEIDALQKELTDVVSAWSTSLATGDLHAYLSAYHEDFSRWQMNRQEWSSFVAHTLAERQISAATIDELLLLAYPGEEGLYLSRFSFQRVEDEQPITTVKRLYWRRDTGGIFRIVAESNG